MIRRFLIFLMIVTGVCLAQQKEQVVGAVETVNAAAGELTIRTDAGKTLAAHLAANCRLMRVEPGEKDLSKATPMELSAVSVGDRLIARGVPADDKLSVTTMVVMSKSALAEKNAREQAEWRTKGVRGVVKTVNASAHELTVSTGRDATAKDWTVSVPESAVLRRYAEGSVKFSDSKIAPLSDIETGDQVRILGTKDEAASKIVAEQVVSGSFRTMGGEVVSIKADSGEMTMKDVQTKKPVVIRMTADTKIHRMPGFGAGGGGMMMRPGGMGGGGMRQGGGMQAGGAARMGGARTPDLGQMIDRLPVATLADVKPGDAVIVSVAKSSGGGAPSAISLIAGVDFLLRASAAEVSQTLGNWNTEMSMPGQ